MSFSWPSLMQATYRIVRLRRLIAAAYVLVAAVLAFAALISPELMSATRAASIFMTMAVLILGHVALFPNVALETLSLSIVGAVFTVVLPVLPEIAGNASPAYYQAALTLEVVFVVLVALAMMTALQKLLEICVYAGPVAHLRITTHLDVPYSAAVAYQQFGLRPETRRGRVMAGPVDPKGFFDVAVVSEHMTDPDDPSSPLVVKLDAKILSSDPQNHETMLVLPNGAVTVTAHRFVPKSDGCRVSVTEMPGDFTYGMHAMFWLTDQQTDNLVEVAELMQNEPSRVNGLAHAVSLLSIAGVVLSPRQPVLD
ncbi:hypothetical protein [Yoonia sp. I 8.24]|uniref:hypothetical protein n=1 Tax=Yoonia sp. I 8.24 TaxID=1537229 RepID=UPI001EDDE7A9|nr:hypothetical protein [Yoonia sp. I 8.24]MCG3266510.1 hypothetical protein [Yoonia sp. I 8.24]